MEHVLIVENYLGWLVLVMIIQTMLLAANLIGMIAKGRPKGMTWMRLPK